MFAHITMHASLLRRYEYEQHKLLLSTLPQSGRGDYDLPDISQEALLARMALDIAVRKGAH